MPNQTSSKPNVPSGALLFFLLTLLSAYACKKYEDKDVRIGEFDAEYAIPLINTSATLQDVLENFDSTTFIEFGEDGLIILNYKGSVNARTSDDIFNVLGEFELIPIPLEDTTTFIPYNELNGIDLDYAILKSGLLRWGFQSEHQEPVSVTLTIPTMTKDGIPFSDTRNVSAYSGTGDPVQGGNLLGLDIEGYRLATVNDTVYIEYVSVGANTGNRDTLKSCYVIFQGLVASYVEGYLGSDLYDLERDTIEIDFFENWTRGDVYFEDPKLTLNIENSFGVPVRSKADVVNVITATGEIIPLVSDFLDSVDIDYPALDEVGEIKYTTFDFNKDNSNVDVLLGSNPIALDYDVDAVPNPDSLASIRGFLTDSSYFQVQMEVEIPIYGTATGFEARDTFSINIDAEDVIFAEFKIVSENDIPLDVALQLYFADSDNVILDSMFVDNPIIMGAAPVDADGEPTGTTELITFSSFDEARYNGIRKAKKLFMRADFSTYNGGAQSVKIYKDDEVRIRAGMKLGVRD